MQINPKTVKKQFEKNMPKYGENAVVQAKLAQKLVDALVSYRTNFDKILELGAGTGMLTAKLAKTVNYNKYFANDFVEKSKSYLQNILPEYVFIKGNAQKIKPNCKMNLIVSNAMFQWFKNIDFCHYANMLEKDGILAFSTFLQGNFREIREVTGLSLEYKTIDEITAALSESFEVLQAEEFTEVLAFSSALEVLAHMKNTGVNSLSSTQWTFKDVKEFCENYTLRYPKAQLTYVSAVVVARRRG